MKTLCLFVMISVPCTVFSQDDPDCAREAYTFFTRMEGYHISSCEIAEFQEHRFWIKSGTEEVVKAGRYKKIWFDKDEGSTRKVSGLQILTNHANAIKKIGGQVLQGTNNVFRASYQGKEIWFELSPSGAAPDEGSWSITSVEVETMKQEILATDIAAALQSAGKIAVYGILFETGSATLNPASATAIAEIATFLMSNPAVRVFVVGHTDNTGDYNANLALSKNRAAGVTKALITKHGIAATRLTAEGVGPLSPVSTNDTEAGRQLNRRVEVVAR
jgi:outer membrane protein OmpA-like peptidoglycan-associated protein